MKLLPFIITFLHSIFFAFSLSAQNIVTDEGAWCWFADPRALHHGQYTYIGYIDVHGNVKATQYDWKHHRKTDVLVRSFFQPDDHNNPTFLVLPDERVMIFYTRHTDEPRIWYRISRKPGDITALGEEKYLETRNNTTYPSPFIMSDDPQHIYLCWRGINWHPTIARLTIPDSEDNCHFDYEPHQVVQSTGARPYAKYISNGKDKIYVGYTTGHPDNEMPNWLYMNIIDINHGYGPILRDMNGQELKRIDEGPFRVNKTEEYATAYPATIIDRTPDIRNWIWQIALDKQEHPVVAYPHIDESKNRHSYWYARWTGATWHCLYICEAGHAFHQSWTQTERCYSGGMTIDPENTSHVYVSIPIKDGQYDPDGVFEIYRYTINPSITLNSSLTLESWLSPTPITKNSTKNNSRPYIIPGATKGRMRLAWMNGDYQYWMVRRGYPQGFPTAIHSDYRDKWKQPKKRFEQQFQLDPNHYSGELFRLEGKFTGNRAKRTTLSYHISETDQRPEIHIGDKVYRSQNRLLSSDDWANKSNGTNGDEHPTLLKSVTIALTYDGKTITIYRDGYVDQVIEETLDVRR